MSETAKSFRDLVVWQKAPAFIQAIHRVLEAFPASGEDGITSQLRRAAVSVAANMVEGWRKGGQADKRRYFNVTEGSADECLYYLVPVRDLKFADNCTTRAATAKVSRLLQAYMNALAK